MKFNITAFFVFTFIFIFCVPIGTLHHELGHYLAGKVVGINSRINYLSTIPINEKNNLTEFYNLYDKNREAIENGYDFIDKPKLIKAKKEFLNARIIFTLGGPLFTILTGTLAFVILLIFSNKLNKNQYLNYCFIFISLFWLRQPMNLLMAINSQLFDGKTNYRSDEFRLAHYVLNSNSWIFIIVSGIIGFCVGCYIVFKIVPYNKRLSFILAGFFGGLMGYYLWLEKFGVYILP